MSEKQVFFFVCKIDDASTRSIHVNAADLITAKNCVEAIPHVLSAEHVDESEIRPDVRAGLPAEPFDCQRSPNSHTWAISQRDPES
jgi:hypothetical protein